MTTDVYLDNPPEDFRRVNELWLWVGIQADGGEGIIAEILPGLGTTPLMSSRREVADSLAPVARKVQRLAMHSADRFVRVELRHFVLAS